MSLVSAALAATIQGLYKAYGNDSAPRCLEFMRGLDQDSLEAQFLVDDKTIFPDSRDPNGGGSATGLFKLLSSSYSKETIVTQIQQGFAEVVPERILQGIDTLAGVNLFNRSLTKVLHKQWSGVLTDVLTAAATLDATTDGTLNLTAQEDLVTFFNAAIEQIELATGKVNNLVLYIPPAVFRLLQGQDQIQTGPGIAAGTEFRRLDAAPITSIEAFFLTKLSVPVRIVVERFIHINSSAANAFQFTTGGYLAQAGDVGEDSWGRVVYQTLPGGVSQDGPVSVYSAPVGIQQLMEPGVIVGASGAWVAKVMSSKRGVKFATTLA